ncbi:MAG: FecR family protein [Spirochaetia bacterium]
MSIRFIAVRALIVGLSALFLIACGGEPETPSTADAQAPSIPIPEPQIAYLTAVGGEVKLGAGTVDLAVGDPLSDLQVIDIGTHSFIDIQFGDRAVARVYGQASVAVWMSGGSPEHPILELVLDSGSVAVKVAYLAPGEVFRVRTPKALYRVAGTRFSVSTGEQDEIAVSEGSVVVFPPSLDLIRLMDSDVTSDGPVRDALVGLENAAPRVLAGEQAAVDPLAMENSDKLAAQLADKLRQIEAAAAASRPSLVQEFLDIVRATRESISDVVVSRPVLSAEVAEKLNRIDELRLLPVPKDPQGLSLLETEEISNLVKFTLRTVPQNSDIFINGLWVGQSVYRGVLRASDSLSIRVSKDGYRERRVQVDRARSEVITVQLERLPPSISAESFVKAIRADDLATVRTYVQEGGSVDVRTDDNIPAVVLASGLIPVLRGQTPDLSYHREILRTVVAADADLEAQFVVEGSTFKLLHASVLAGVAGFDVLDLVALFTDAGADVDGTIFLEGEELTPLAVAVRWALFTGETQEEILKILLQAGASLDVAISFNDELLTLKEIAAELIEGGDLVDPELIRLLRLAGLAS